MSFSVSIHFLSLINFKTFDYVNIFLLFNTEILFFKLFILMGFLKSPFIHMQ